MKHIKMNGEQALGFFKEIGISATLPRQKTKLEQLAADVHFLGNSLGPLFIELTSVKNIRLTADAVRKDVKSGAAQATLAYGVEELYMLKILSEAIATELNEVNVEVVLFNKQHPAASEKSIDESMASFVSDDSFLSTKDSALLSKQHFDYLEKSCGLVPTIECLQSLVSARPELRVFLRASGSEKASLRRDFVTPHPVFVCGYGLALNQISAETSGGFKTWVETLNLHRAHGMREIFGCCIESGIVVNTARRAQALAEKLVQNYQKSIC